MTHVPLPAAVLDAGRFVASASSSHSPTSATVACFSIATTAAPLAGTPHCNSAPSDASAGSSSRILSADTPGPAVVVSSVFFLAGRRVDFFGELSDCDWGSWEGSLPESSSLGGDGTPLRGALFINLRSSIRGFKNSLAGKLYQLWKRGVTLSAIHLRRPGPFWSAKMAHFFAATG